MAASMKQYRERIANGSVAPKSGATPAAKPAAEAKKAAQGA